MTDDDAHAQALLSAALWHHPAPGTGGGSAQVPTIHPRDALTIAWWALSGDDTATAAAIEAALADAEPAAAVSLPEYVGCMIADRCDAAWEVVDNVCDGLELDGADRVATAMQAVHAIADAVRAQVDPVAVLHTLRADLLTLAGRG